MSSPSLDSSIERPCPKITTFRNVVKVRGVVDQTHADGYTRRHRRLGLLRSRLRIGTYQSQPRQWCNTVVVS